MAIKYEIVKEICVLSESKGGANKKEINIVAWGSGKPKLDIRNWIYDENDIRQSPGKGITMDWDEYNEMYNSMDTILDELDTL